MEKRQRPLRIGVFGQLSYVVNKSNHLETTLESFQKSLEKSLATEQQNKFFTSLPMRFDFVYNRIPRAQFDGIFFIVGSRPDHLVSYELTKDRALVQSLKFAFSRDPSREVPIFVIHRGRPDEDFALEVRSFFDGLNSAFIPSGSRRKFDRLPRATLREAVQQFLLHKKSAANIVEEVHVLQDDEASPDYLSAIGLFSPILISRLLQRPEDIFNLHPEAFERLVAALLEDEGFEIEPLGRWNEADGGVDIMAVRYISNGLSIRTAVQCKRYARDRKISAEPIRALAGVLDRFKAHVGVIATTSYFTSAAQKEAGEHFWRINLRDYERLVADMKNYGIYKRTESGLWLPGGEFSSPGFSHNPPAQPDGYAAG
jgi:hypothetical protein